MHGLVNRSIECFLRDTYGPGIWAGVAVDAGPADTGVAVDAGPADTGVADAGPAVCDVEVSLPDLEAAKGRTPVIVDDIVSSGRTVIEALGHLNRLGLRDAVCIAIHAVFAQDAFQQVLAAGAARVVSTDSISHPSNAISLAPLLVQACADLLSADEQT